MIVVFHVVVGQFHAVVFGYVPMANGVKVCSASVPMIDVLKHLSCAYANICQLPDVVFQIGIYNIKCALIFLFV